MLARFSDLKVGIRELSSAYAGEATTSNHKDDCIPVFTVGGPTPAVKNILAETTGERQL